MIHGADGGSSRDAEMGVQIQNQALMNCVYVSNYLALLSVCNLRDGSVDLGRPVGAATQRERARYKTRGQRDEIRETRHLPRTAQTHTLPPRRPDRRQDEVNATVSS